MDIKTRNDYVRFYYNISRAVCCDIGIASAGKDEAIKFAVKAKTYYLKLQEDGVKDIVPIRECLNAFGKRLGVEVLVK